MKIEEKFTPPYPRPHKHKIDRIKRFFIGLGSWIHTLYKKSYSMKMGEVKFPRLNMFIVNESNLVNKILIDKEGKFPKHFIQHDMMCPLLGESVFSTNGDKWKKQREMINPSFAHTNLKSVFEMMKESSNELIDNLKSQTKNYIHIDPIMTHVTADIIFRTILSNKIDQYQAHIIHKAFNKYQNYAQYIASLKLYKLPTFGLGWVASKSANHIHRIFEKIVKDRYKEFHKKLDTKEDIPNKDILDSLMQAKHPDTNQHFTFKEIIDQLSIIFLAGHETSASSLTWSLYLLSKCPHLQKAAYEEVSQYGDITFENIRKLKIVDSIFQESLRLYPPVSFFPREAACDLELRNKKVKKQDMLSISPWLMHRNPNYWDNPNEFDTDRFIEPDNNTKESIRSTFIPFGKGKRICIGAGFAKQEALIILSDIIRNFKIDFKKDHIVEPVSRMTTRPKNGVYLMFRMR